MAKQRPRIGDAVLIFAAVKRYKTPLKMKSEDMRGINYHVCMRFPRLHGKCQCGYVVRCVLYVRLKSNTNNHEI